MNKAKPDNKGPVTMDINTEYPDTVWKQKQYVKIVLEPDIGNTPIQPNHLRFVCISDTHNRHSRILNIPKGDVLLHMGDFTSRGKCDEVMNFNDWLGTLDFTTKIVIAGNHEFCMDKLYAKYTRKRISTPDDGLLSNCIYLMDSSVTVAGIKIYGSPWTPEFCSMGFNMIRGEPILKKWNLIPEDTDILMTHGPPLGYGDIITHGKKHVGCVELLNSVQQRVKPQYHLFGHIHEDRGMWTDGVTTFINASICDRRYQPVNLPIVFDMPLPEGEMKPPRNSETELL